MVSNPWGGICKFCFRKRLFHEGRLPDLCELSKTIDYLQDKPELTDVLLSNGDPIMLSPSGRDEILTRIRELSQISVIRIGSKLLAYDPNRICENPDLTDVIAKHSHPDKRIYVVTHFNHSNEITGVSESTVNQIKIAGAEIINQTPLIQGVNDDPHTLELLLKRLTSVGIPPYYIFQCRPALRNLHHTIPIERAIQGVHQAQFRFSGLAKRARYIMSHRTGKIEILGMTHKHTYMRYHQGEKLQM